MFTAIHAEAMHQVFEERLKTSEYCRMRRIALRRSRARSTLRRAIEEVLRHGVEPHEVEHEFTFTLREVTSR